MHRLYCKENKIEDECERMKINPNPTIRCGGYDICKSKNYFPCTDCFHKVIE